MAIIAAVVTGGNKRGGSAAHPNPGTSASTRNTASPQTALKVTVNQTGALPAGVQDAAAVAVGPGRGLLIGGLNQGEASVSDILALTPTGATKVGELATALHDASAAFVGGFAYVMGGGQLSSFPQITRVDASGGSAPAGQLPTPASDLATATVGSTVYIVGGYTGVTPLRTILVWQPGGGARTVATLPKPLRYAAVANVGGQLLIAGGTSGEAASRDIYRFDPTTDVLTKVGELPAPLTHAGAAAAGGSMLVVGGRDAAQNTQTSRILAISPNGGVRVVGTLPQPLSDVSVVSLGDQVVAAGGRDGSGQLHDSILTLSVSGS